MSYVKQTFIDGTTKLKAEHLKHMEDGIAANAQAIAELGGGSAGSGPGLLFDIVSEFSGNTSGGGSGDSSGSSGGDTTDVPAAAALATDSWVTIAAALKSGTHPYAIGDTKEIMVGDTSYTIRLCDLVSGRYSYADGSGSSKAVFEFVNIYGTAKQYINGSERTNVGGYAATLTPAFMTDTVFPSLPSDLRAVIPAILLPYNVGGQATTIEKLECKLFLASAYEITGDSTNNTGAAEGSPQYQLHAGDDAAKIKNFNGSATYWWTRTPNASGSLDYLAINPSGAIQSLGSLGNQAIVPFFAI